MNAPGRHSPLPVAVGGFKVILADPPWPFRSWSDKGRDRCPDALVRQKGLAERHYRVMSLAGIELVPVGDIAARDSALFLWTVDCHLPEALAVGEAWGFASRRSRSRGARRHSPAAGISVSATGRGVTPSSAYCSREARPGGSRQPCGKTNRCPPSRAFSEAPGGLRAHPRAFAGPLRRAVRATPPPRLGCVGRSITGCSMNRQMFLQHVRGVLEHREQIYGPRPTTLRRSPSYWTRSVSGGATAGRSIRATWR